MSSGHVRGAAGAACGLSPARRAVAAEGMLEHGHAAARAAGLSISRIQPEGEDGVRVWIDRAPSTQVFAFLIAARRDHGLSASSVSLTSRDGSGEVTLEATLTRGGGA